MIFAWGDFGLSYAGVDVWRDIIGVELPAPWAQFSAMCEGLIASLLIGIGSTDGEGTSGSQETARGSDLRYNLTLTLREAHQGVIKIISLELGGSDSRSLSVKIPRGVEDGTRIRLSGEGESGTNGGASGDLYIFISINDDSSFTRADADLFVKIAVPLTLAKEGGKLFLDSIDGSKLEVKIPPGFREGKQLRIRGKGMPILRSKNFGDLYIQTDIIGQDNIHDQKKHDGKKNIVNENLASQNATLAEKKYNSKNVQKPTSDGDVEKFDVASINDSDDTQTKPEDEDVYDNKLKRIILNKRSRQLTLKYYSTKYPTLNKEEIVKKIFEDYERDRS